MEGSSHGPTSVRKAELTRKKARSMHMGIGMKTEDGVPP
jgi:hypothetical protein